jgi:hypothetical protein
MVYLSMRKYDIINHRSEPVKRLPKIYKRWGFLTFADCIESTTYATYI